MPVPSSIADLSTTASSNSPLGTENVGTLMNEYIQAAFAFIAQINANLTTNFTPLGTLTAPAGTRVVMQQASAPAGWTVDTSATLTDCAMRFNQTVGSGGTSGWSTWNNNNTFAVSATALTANQMPYHNHGVNDPGHSHGTSVGDPGHSHGVNDPGHNHILDAYSFTSGGIGTMVCGQIAGAHQQYNTESSNTGISLNSSGTGVSVSVYGNATGISTQYAGLGQSHGHNFTTPSVKYADCIVAIKS